MRNFKIIVLITLLMLNISMIYAQTSIPFNSDFWEIEDADGQDRDLDLTTLYDTKCLHLPVGHRVYLKDSTIHNFRLEMDIAGVIMPGLGFRGIDKNNYEYLYLRIMSDNQGDALQYIPVFNGSFSWQLYNYPKYEHKASFPKRFLVSLPWEDTTEITSGQNIEYVKEIFGKGEITLGNNFHVVQADSLTWKVLDPEKINIYYITRDAATLNVYTALEWIHIKLEVLENTAMFYVEDMNTPNMVIDDLKHENPAGFVLLRNLFADSYYANINIEKIDLLQSTTETEEIYTPPEYLSEWEISEKFVRNDQNIHVQIDSVKRCTKQWKKIKSEPSGLINLSRYFEETVGSVLMKTTINSPADKSVDLLFDYSERLVISLNSDIVFSDSLQMGDNGGRVMDGDIKTDLKLKEGDNEIVFVISSDPYKQNWGVIAKITDLEK